MCDNDSDCGDGLSCCSGKCKEKVKDWINAAEYCPEVCVGHLFGKHGSCGGLDQCNTEPIPEEKKPENLGVKSKHSCIDGTIFECNSGTLGCNDNSHIYCKESKQSDESKQPKDNNTEVKRVEKTIRKIVGFNFVASGTGSKFFFTEHAIIRGKLVDNKISISQILVSGDNKLPSQYVNKEYKVSQNGELLNVTFSPEISVGPVSINGFTMNTVTKVIHIHHNNFLTLSAFKYKKQSIYRTEKIMVETNVPKIIDSYKKDKNYPAPSVPSSSIHDLHTDLSDDDNLTPPLPLVVKINQKSF